MREPGAASAPTRVLVVDDRELFRIGLRGLLADEGFVVRDADSTEEALRRLPSFLPQVVVVGVNRPGPSGVEATRRLLAEAPGTAVLLLSVVADDEEVVQAVRAGAAGHLLKSAELAQIVAGIRSVAAGQSALSPHAARTLIEQIRLDAERVAATAALEAPRLSERERQVLALLAAGCDNSQIAGTLFVSRSTVKNHVSRVLEKLEVDNRVQAATYAIRAGLVDGLLPSD